MSDFIKDPADIERLSLDIIEGLIDTAGYPFPEIEVVKRVVHATADPEFAGTMLFSEGAVGAGVEAIRRGCKIITDVRMLQAGVSPRRPGGGDNTYCFISDPDVVQAAREAGTTRAAAAMRKAAGFMEGAIVAVGNAPTALYELMAIVEEGGPRPALVVGVPVGFVGAAESKAELAGRLTDIPYITNRGRKGGSPVGAAAVNAMILLSVNN